MHIVIITSSARALLGLRKELVESWVKNGHRVTAIGELSEDEFSQYSKSLGIGYRCVTLERNGLNPIKDYKTLTGLSRLLKELNPDRVFCTFAKAVAYGAWAARRVGIEETYALISGLGSGFRGYSTKEKIVRFVMSKLYKNAFKGCKKVVFQNYDDVGVFVRLNLLEESKVEVVNGSGVDLNRFRQEPLPNKKTFLFVGRLLREKGIREYIEAAKIVKKIRPDSRFMVVGDIDSNPSSLTKSEVDEIQNKGLIEFYGFQSDVKPFIDDSDIFVLPSYHEGTPRCVLEAMSVGRPIITTDAPGCRETVENERNGFLVPVRDPQTLAERMIYLLDNPDIADQMGKYSRILAERKYDVNKINSDYIRIMNLN